MAIKKEYDIIEKLFKITLKILDSNNFLGLNNYYI